MPRRLRNNTTIIPDASDIAAHQAETILLIANEKIMAEAAALPVASVEDVWKTTLFSEDFNLGTKLGNSIFIEKTKGLAKADCLDLNKANSLAIQKVFRSLDRIMGDVISKIPTQFNADGTVTLAANLLITLKNVQCAAIARNNVALGVTGPIPSSLFSMKTLNPGNNGNEKSQFYKKFHSSVVAHLIKNILSVTGYDDFLLQQDKFAFYNDAVGEMGFDGATMIYILYLLIRILAQS